MDTPRAPDDPQGQVWVLCPCVFKVVIDRLSTDPGSETQVRIEGRHECRPERRSSVGCELLVGNGPESVHHGIGGHFHTLPFGHWGFLGGWDENVEKIGVEKFRNRGERHDLGTRALSGRR